MYSKLADMHTHTNHSFDGNNTCEEMCKKAIESNYFALAITDHCEMDAKDFNFHHFIKNHYEDININSEKFKNQISLIKGLELGQGIYNKSFTEELLKQYDYDFYLGSIHNLENLEDFYYLDYKYYDIGQLLNEYFNNIYRLTKWDLIDSIAHLTYPLRYIVYRSKIDVNLNEYKDQIESILESIIVEKKSIELNVSGLFTSDKYTMPDKNIIKKYIDMGGKYITIGSDSHYSSRIGSYIDTGYDILKNCGCNQFTIYKNHEPHLIDIE